MSSSSAQPCNIMDSSWQDTERALRNSMKCPICMELPEAEVYQCENGHMICATCVAPLLRCPFCNSSLKGNKKFRNRAMEDSIGCLRIDCKYKDDGCLEVVLRKELAAHLKSCKFRSVHICKLIGLTGCDFTAGKSSDCLGHLAEQHAIDIRQLFSRRMFRRRMGRLEDLLKLRNEEGASADYGFAHAYRPGPGTGLEMSTFLFIWKMAGDELSMACLYFNDLGGPYPSDKVPSLDVMLQVPNKDAGWSWTGHPTYYKDANEAAISRPPFRIPVEHLRELFLSSEVDDELWWEVSCRQNKRCRGVAGGGGNYWQWQVVLRRFHELDLVDLIFAGLVFGLVSRLVVVLLSSSFRKY